jgi:hypothetical protein
VIGDDETPPVSAAAEKELASYVYRRIHPHGWNARGNKPKESSFIARPGTGLSVFRADLTSPRQVLQHALDVARALSTSPDEHVRQRGEKQLRDFGDTVETWVQNGWRVVRIPTTAFLERGFSLDEPDTRGHQNVYGDHVLHSVDLVDIAEVLTDEECLADAP